MTSARLYWNYVAFCVLYALLHGTVDAVLAFAAAELGPTVGSLGGFILYFSYTMSALVIAQPILDSLDSKPSVLTGMALMLLYIDGFLLAVLSPANSGAYFAVGSLLGGVGAGIMWSGQGSYYTRNARLYAESLVMHEDEVLNTFAGIFAGFLLIVEFVVKTIGSAVYFVNKNKSGDGWKQASFGAYSCFALVAVVLFWVLLLPLAEPGFLPNPSVIPQSQHGLTKADNTPRDEEADVAASSPESEPRHDPCSPAVVETTNTELPGSRWTAVLRIMYTSRTLQLLLPFQFCFGFSSGLVNTYVLGVIVREYLYDGYVGILSGLMALTAAVVAWPFSAVSNRYRHGRAGVMVLGALCFAFGAGAVLCFSDAQLAQPAFMVIYFVVRGVARGVWEGVNKANIALCFRDSTEDRQAAFAAIYFASGLAGALGFLSAGVLSRNAVAGINFVLSVGALVCYLLSSRGNT
jgi:hypothetical protein